MNHGAVRPIYELLLRHTHTHTHKQLMFTFIRKNIVVSIGIAQFVDIISTFNFYNIQQNMIDFLKNLQNILCLIQGSFL